MAHECFHMAYYTFISYCTLHTYLILHITYYIYRSHGIFQTCLFHTTLHICFILYIPYIFILHICLFHTIHSLHVSYCTAFHTIPSPIFFTLHIPCAYFNFTLHVCVLSSIILCQAQRQFGRHESLSYSPCHTSVCTRVCLYI